MRGVASLEHLALASATLDRATDLRTDPDWLAARWAAPGTRVLVLHEDRAEAGSDGSGLGFTSPASVDVGPDERYFLGLDGSGTAYFAAPGRAFEDSAAISLREAGDRLDEEQAGLFVHAVSLANWHARHTFCARCGSPTRVAAGGHVRNCGRCGAEHFPRTDPAIIVLVTDGEDRCLLGHQPRWPPLRFSTLAGFVEPGESLEQAVAREVAEETGVAVGETRYAGSQPWPFPSSLMLGFFASAGREPGATGIEVDGEEISEARWFSREDLRAAAAAGKVELPGAVSISRRLIEAWYGEPLSDT